MRQYIFNEEESIIQTYHYDPCWVKIQPFLPQANRLTADNLPKEYFIPILDMDIHIDHYRPVSPKGRLILFHGVGGNGRLLSCIALPLARAGFEVICPDLPLYGYTRYISDVTYDTWVTCGTEIVKYYQEKEDIPTFLCGLSAGGMLAYQAACESRNIKGLIVSCILDQREKAVIRNSANNPLLGIMAKPLMAALHTFAGRVRIPMKWIGNMKAIANHKELVEILIKDEKSSGVKVPVNFIYTMLNPQIKTEPEQFTQCPVLLAHPGDDRWTDIELSNLFYNRLSCEKRTVILEGAGHFPMEEIGLRQMEQACIRFLEKHL